jgi:hypothetical protein
MTVVRPRLAGEVWTMLAIALLIPVGIILLNASLPGALTLAGLAAFLLGLALSVGLLVHELR